MIAPPSFPPDSGIEILSGVDLADFSTFRLGGPCRHLIQCDTEEQVTVAVRTLREENSDFMLLGGGSNILISDEGYPGIVVRYAAPDLAVERAGGQLIVGAGGSLDALAAYTAEQGLEGLMCCTGIPGTVGGAVVGNAGAWGRQIADVLVSIRLLDRRGTVREVAPNALHFAYRRSDLQQSEDIVLSVTMQLNPGDPAALMEQRREILQTRAEKHPDLSKEPCIGSIFRNIEPTSAAGRRQAAGGFLEDAGAKQLSVGGARIFPRHANIVINTPGCTAQDVFELIERMRQCVKERFHLDLIREVRFLGRFAGEEGGFH